MIMNSSLGLVGAVTDPAINGIYTHIKTKYTKDMPVISEFGSVFKHANETSGNGYTLAEKLPEISGMFPTSFDEMESSMKVDKAEVENVLEYIYKKYNINPESDISIVTDPYTGKVTVGSDDMGAEMAALIEKDLNQNDGFMHHYKRLSAISSLYEAGKRHMEMTKAYEANPIEAVQRFGNLFDDSSTYRFTLNYKNGCATADVSDNYSA